MCVSLLNADASLYAVRPITTNDGLTAPVTRGGVICFAPMLSPHFSRTGKRYMEPGVERRALPAIHTHDHTQTRPLKKLPSMQELNLLLDRMMVIDGVIKLPDKN